MYLFNPTLDWKKVVSYQCLYWPTNYIICVLYITLP